MNVVMNVDQRAVWSSDPHDLLSVLLWLPVVSVSLRSDNFVRVHGGRSEGRVGDEPAQAGRQRHRLGCPELWEVSLIFVWVGSPPTGFFFEATQICCVGFFFNLSLHVELPVTHSWSSVFTAAGPQWVWLLGRRSSLNVCGLFVMKLMSLQMHREH